MIISNTEEYPIFARIDALRSYAISCDTRERQYELDSAICTFDAELKLQLEYMGVGELARKCVPEWHKLVGSTPEEFPIDIRVKEHIVGEVERLVLELEANWGL